MEREKVKNNFGEYPAKSNVVVENAKISTEKGTNKLGNASRIFETTKITALNTDCMEAIFEYLEFDDLLNVNESSKQFHFAVSRVYQRNYSDHALIHDPNICMKYGVKSRY